MSVTFQYKSGRTRRMQRRYADILQKLGHGTYMTRDMRAQPPGSDDVELAELRAEYQDVVGKRAYHGWDADTLRDKIEEARE